MYAQMNLFVNIRRQNDYTLILIKHPDHNNSRRLTEILCDFKRKKYATLRFKWNVQVFSVIFPVSPAVFSMTP